MSTVNQCRDIGKLHPLAQVQLKRAIKEMKAKGVNPLVVETLRTVERQHFLYGQGRTSAQCTSKGVPAKYAQPSLKQCTWTLNSIHIKGMAVDIVPQRSVNGKMTAIWNAKDKDTVKIISIMEKYGFEPGANWKSSPDSPHFQIAKVNPNCKVYSANNTNPFVTKMIQSCLKEKVDSTLKVDGQWGAKTTEAVNAFRKMNKWSANGSLGTRALATLIA